MKVTLKNTGNPDHWQDPGKPVWGTPSAYQVEVWSIEEAQEEVRKYIDKWNLGGGNFNRADIHNGKTLVGSISYNGRFWPGDSLKNLGKPNAKSWACAMVLYLMTQDDDPSYEKILNRVLEESPMTNRENLEEELNKYI